MAAYPPPNSTVAIFNPVDFIFNNFPLTIADAANFFLSYPTAQGTETLLTTIVNGSSTFNDTATFNDLVEVKQPTPALNALNLENDLPGQSITATSTTSQATAGLLTQQGSAAVNDTNPIVEAGDSVISSSIFGVDDTGGLTLTQKSTANPSGIRLNSNKVNVFPGIKFPDGTEQTTAAGAGGAETLADTLVLGNSAGATDIDMNTQNITNATAITTGTLNYTTLNPPVGGSETFADTLVLGNSAGTTDVDMNNQDITDANEITTNSVMIKTNQVPQTALTNITNYYNNNSAYTINNYFVNYNNGATPTNTYKQNLGKVVWNAETPDSSNIYYLMTFEWSLSLSASSSNSFSNPVNQAPSITSSGLFSFMPYWLPHYAVYDGITSFTATQGSSPQTVYIRWGANSTTNYPGSWTCSAPLTIDWDNATPNQLIFSYLNVPFTAGGTPGAIMEWRADFNVRCLGKGGVPSGVNINNYFLTLDPTELTGINVP